MRVVYSHRDALSLLLAVLVSLTAWLYFSPLHVHDRNAKATCPFQPMEHGYGSEAPPIAPPDPPDLSAWAAVLEHSAETAGAVLVAEPSRAPPSLSTL